MTWFFKFLCNHQFGGQKNDLVLQILCIPPWNWVILACKIQPLFFSRFEISLFNTVIVYTTCALKALSCTLEIPVHFPFWTNSKTDIWLTLEILLTATVIEEIVGQALKAASSTIQMAVELLVI
jgi:hypothetical protein